MLRPEAGYPDSGVTEWRVLVTVDGVPCARLRLPDPGPGAGAAYLDATVRRAAQQHVDYDAAVERLRGRLDPRARPGPPPLTRSVVVCTHRRPDDVAVLLAALQALDPAPEEIIIVDNAPGDEDCRAEVAAAGARYVREDRVGLDHARRAGLLAATGDVVCFTDDDCAPAAHWLRRLPELFADPSVGAVTGPGFARELRTASQVRFEDTGGFSRGLRPRVADWRSLSPLRATAMGAGANMSFRRELLLSLGDVFPAELDAGTPTQSGGDMIAMYRVMAAGHRIAYDPSTYILHRHRRDPRSLHHGMWGYGVGLAAALTRLLVRERELGAITSWLWLWQQYRAALRGRWYGYVDAVEQRIAWDYLRGGLVGPWAWWRSRGLEEPPPPAPVPARVARQPVLAGGDAAMTEAQADPTPLAFSVVVATRDRPLALARCLGALAAQRPVAGGFEVLVVDDDPAAAADIPAEVPLTVRVLRSGGAGAAGARNLGAREARGEHLLFLDDDLVPEPDLVACHLAHHRRLEAEAMVIGVCPPAPVEPTLAAQAAALWWVEHYRAKADAAALMFVDVLSGNASLPNALFERLGGFDAEFAIHRREDWDFGVRVLRAGVPAVYAPDAIASHEFRLTTRGAIAAAQREGTGDALLAARWPEVAATLSRDAPPGRLDRPISALLGLSRAQRLGPAVLDALERLHARRYWLGLFHQLREAAYTRARREAGAGAPAGAARPQILTVDLAADAPVPSPAVAAPLVEVRWRGRRLGRVRPVDGQWVARDLAFQMLDVADPKLWGEIGGQRPALATEGAGPPGVTHETVHVPAWEDEVAWRGLDERVRRSQADVVVLALWGRSGFRVPAGGLDAFASPRVGLVFGGRSGETALEAARVYSREVPYWGRDLPCPVVEYLAVRPDVLDRVGGLEGWSRRLGGQALAQELADRVLAAGHHVAQQDVPGRLPAPPGTRPTWRRDRAAGGRAVRRLAQAGPGAAGLPEFLRAVPWSPRPHSFAFHGAAFTVGVVRGLRHRHQG